MANLAFLDDKKFADVRFLLKDGEYALGHKAFFAARIPSIADRIKTQEISDLFNKITCDFFSCHEIMFPYERIPSHAHIILFK